VFDELPFATVEERVEVAGRTLRLLRPEDPYSVVEVFLDEDQKGPDAFSGQVWPSALALARFILEGAALRGPALDLGTGLGLTALAAASAGVEVVATDAAPFVLALLRESARRNGVADLVRTRVYRWGEPLGERFVTVLAADVLYREQNIYPLLATLDSALAPGGEALFADPGRDSSKLFLSRIGSSYRVEPTPLQGGIHLYRIRCIP
jgi:predicted nicotinamide N-methyase